METEEKKITWNISPFPEKLKNLFVAKAKEKGTRVPDLMEIVMKTYLQTYENEDIR